MLLYPLDVGGLVGELIQVVDFHDSVVGSDHGPIVDGRSESGITNCFVKRNSSIIR